MIIIAMSLMSRLARSRDTLEPTRDTCGRAMFP
jgi:hypothetical protein